MQIISIILRIVLLVLYVTDILMNRRLKKKNNTLRRQLSKSQNNLKIAFHFIVMTGLLVPFDSIFILVTIGAIVFFFVYTDREVYISNNAMHFRDRYFEFKKIKNFSYQNNTFEFDYNDEHIKLAKPFLEKAFLQREIVHRIEKIATKEERKEKKAERKNNARH